MDMLLTNSEKNAAELRLLAPWVTTWVLYPFVDTRIFNPKASELTTDEANVARNQDLEILKPLLEAGGYFLSYARLAHAKRIDEIIRAFRELPSLQLLVLYGVNDPQKKEFMELAKGCPNIIFHTLADNTLVPHIVARSRSVLYVSKNEDFGMNTIESLACWIPVIAVAEGGFLETMIDGENGILLSPHFTQDDLRKAIVSMTVERSISLKERCIERAQVFSLTNFSVRLKEYISKMSR
jgi:glycosyltransferase involved in cell wall biosynthesis